MRAAASSIASGMPWSVAQIAATAGAFALLTVNPGFTAVARLMNRRTASNVARVSRSSSRKARGRLSRSISDRCRVSGGAGRPGTGYSCSPDTRRATRVVTSAVRPGHRRSSSAITGPAPTTCSKLSRTNSTRRSPIESTIASTAGRARLSATPSVRRMVGATRSGSRTDSRATNQTPSG